MVVHGEVRSSREICKGVQDIYVDGETVVRCWIGVTDGSKVGVGLIN